MAHRVDLNLVVDYGWPLFLQHGPQFVDEVDDDQDLVDLLSALNEHNITAAGNLYAGLAAPSSDGKEASDDAQTSAKVS